MLWGHHRSAGIRLLLPIRRQCRIHVCKPLRIKSFHEVWAGNAHECSLNSTIGKASIFILHYIQDPVFRRVINLQLNKGEQVHELRQFIHFANEGKIRSHLEEQQINEASCLNLVVNAIILWNTVYMQAIIEQLRKEGYQISDEDLRHLGPARHEHINPYGHYTFNVQQELQRKGLRPLRNP